MDESPNRRKWLAAGRTLAWAIGGAAVGVAIGGLVGYWTVPHAGSDQLQMDGGVMELLGWIINLFGSLLRLVTTLVGGGVGGILGAIVGAVASRLLPSNGKQ